MPSIWVVFSSTPYKTGRFIRQMLGTRFNHVGLCLEPSLCAMDTFARRYVNAPFSGGYVKESFRRFFYRGRWADIKVCRVDLTERQMRRLQAFLRVFRRRSKKSLYNLYSAAAVPLGWRIHIRDSYTCVEFVGDALAYAGVKGFLYGGFHSLEGTEQLLSAHVEYVGSAGDYPAEYRWGEDAFLNRRRRTTVIKETAGAIARLTARSIRGFGAWLMH
ncbi:MAG: hypothetical protein IJW40_05100 [Clostridia bacterium]|nr:hypothetical protein [Clostridia bacterium]